MKKYKLIKDLPDISAGKIFTWNESENCYKAEKDIWVSPNRYATYSKGTVEESITFFEKYTDKKLCNTEDGVPIYEGDLIHFVGIHNEIKYLYCINFAKLHLSLDFINTFKVFSTEKAAKDWINLNKPQYSLQNIQRAFNINGGVCCYNDFIKELSHG